MFDEKKTPLLLPEKAASSAAYDPMEEIRQTGKIVNEGGAAPVAESETAVEVLAGPDSAFEPGNVIHGERFDPARHKTHPNGQPVLGSKKQLLLKKESKKSARQKLSDGVKNFFGKKEDGEGGDVEIPAPEEIPDNGEIREIPLSDHEYDAAEREKAEERGPEPKTREEISEWKREQRKSAEKSANGIVFSSSLVLGPEILRQRKSEEFKDLVDACAEWEDHTGHKIELHPNLAFPFAVMAAMGGMVKNEPACKARTDAAAVMVRQNVLGALGEKVPFLKSFLGEGAPIPAAPESDEPVEKTEVA